MDNARGRRYRDILTPVLLRSGSEAMRAHILRPDASRYEIGLTDLLTAIILEPDILQHLVDDRDLPVNVPALRRKRSPEMYERQEQAAEQQDHGSDTVVLRPGLSPTVEHSQAYNAVLEATAAWAASDAGQRDFSEWEPHASRDTPGQQPPHLPASLAGMPPDALAQIIENARAQGMPDDEARKMYEGLTRFNAPLSADDAWTRKLSDRNFRYAVLRELFERALAAGRDEVDAALRDMSITVLDLQATFDEMAMSHSWPDP